MCIRDSLTGLSGLQREGKEGRRYELRVESQSPYGAKWFATGGPQAPGGGGLGEGSQSPYGAKWFATS